MEILTNPYYDYTSQCCYDTVVQQQFLNQEKTVENNCAMSDSSYFAFMFQNSRSKTKIFGTYKKVTFFSVVGSSSVQVLALDCTFTGLKDQLTGSSLLHPEVCIMPFETEQSFATKMYSYFLIIQSYHSFHM